MRKIVVIVLLAAAVAVALPFLDRDEAPPSYQGWVEADTLMIGAETVGRLAEVHVEEGTALAAGHPLFRLDPSTEEAAVAAARAALARAEAELDLARAAQKRPEEIDVLKASEREAVARLDLSVQELERMRALVRQGSGTRANLDTAIATEAANRAALDSVRSQITLATLPAREQDIRQAEEAVRSAEADLEAAKASLAERSVAAPAAGIVQRIYYRTGEVVPAGRPVIALLPPDNIRIRFFVPEPDLANLSLGRTVRLACDGCEPSDARVAFIADEAEFTPPVIFSTEERAKLVYRIEAIPARPETLRPGQPVDVLPGAGP
ncbi:MAG TPA: HlyD family efflux transporter periplasmic adaptor subunit [Pseudorhizobium sp.]|nr:HlyD family efflux transporter periplasmic adaptor subunit [Pseudorhizobium sp.]